MYGMSEYINEVEQELTSKINKLVEALAILVDHAEETYPHFESERGQRDIKRARKALEEVNG